MNWWYFSNVKGYFVRRNHCESLPRNRKITMLRFSCMARLSLCIIALLSTGIYPNSYGQTFTKADPANFASDASVFAWNIDSTANAGVTDLSSTLTKPAGQHGFVRRDGEHFATDAGPIKFWATNICFSGSFPSHEGAEAVAAKLARFGVSCVRLHHMDMRDIWGKSPNKRTLDPEQLEKLDYLIAQLCKHGIYVNINLHVSRTLGEEEGFPVETSTTDNESSIPNFDKGLDQFEPRMIEAQKEYARDLLTHVNPYTGNAYTDEPAVAFVEINNENALSCQWGWGELDHLPQPYQREFQSQWNAWLTKKYGTTAALRQAWNCKKVPLGDELLGNTDFSDNWQKCWSVERDEVSQTTLETGDFGPDSHHAMRISIAKMGSVSWNPQMHHPNLSVNSEQPYTFSFAARSDQARTLTVNCRQNVDPWSDLGLLRTIQLGPEWKTFSFTFEVSSTESNARVGFSGFDVGVYEFADMSFRTGGETGITEDETLEAQNIPTLQKKSMNLPKPARYDWIDFLRETESNYWSEMLRFLKDDLHVKSLITGTQMRWGVASDQSQMDFVDAHDYWNHPVFPGRPWDGKNWYTSDEPLINHPEGSIAKLSATRVLGLPYTVSEFNEPQPITWAPEGFVLISAYGAFQNWDAIYSFAWKHDNHFDTGRISSFFDIESDAARLVHFPACVNAFIRGDIRPSEQIYAGEYLYTTEQKLHRQEMQPYSLDARKVGIASEVALLHGIGLDTGAVKSPTPWTSVNSDNPITVKEEPQRYSSDTAEMEWDLSQKNAGCFTASSPKTKMFTGFIRDRKIDFGDIEITVGKTRSDWATITLTTVQGESMDTRVLQNSSEKTVLLLAITGEQQNTDMQLRQDGTHVTCSDQWGTSPILCEGVAADISLPVASERVTVRPLDGRGSPMDTNARLDGHGDQTTIHVGPEYKTLWYAIEIEAVR